MPDQPKRYIVTFEQTQSSDETLSALGMDYGSLSEGVSALMEIGAPPPDQGLRFEELGAAVLPLSEDEVERLRNSKHVAEVVEDFEVVAHAAPVNARPRSRWIFPPPWETDCLPPTQPGRFSIPEELLQWNIKLVRAQEAWNYATGKGVKVAILDSGIDSTHPDLEVAGGASLVEGVDSWEDDNGHGTHCAGIAGARNFQKGSVGVAPECELYAVKVLRGGGEARGNLSWILAGMQWAAQNGMHVVSMSLGSPAITATATCIVAYQRSAQLLLNSGCLLVCSAGNAFLTSQPWVNQPARCPGFMAVASVDASREISPTSSRGPESLSQLAGVEISAPGVLVRSTIPGGKYRVASGTSMACPHISGAAALVRQLNPSWTPGQIRNRLKQTATPIGDPVTFGAGLLDCLRAVQP
ncbi:MAG: S8 family peptidase [Bryobacteraceae bacterium]|nr:S8 family peptidase [Bryobacteraceae bacterium]